MCAAFDETETIEDKSEVFSSTTIAVRILVVDAILHCSFSFFPYKIVLEALSYITACLAFIIGTALSIEEEAASVILDGTISSK